VAEKPEEAIAPVQKAKSLFKEQSKFLEGIIIL
jgi:hypothetical protein